MTGRINRRRFLKATAIGAAATGIAGCIGGGGGGTGGGGTGGGGTGGGGTGGGGTGGDGTGGGGTGGGGTGGGGTGGDGGGGGPGPSQGLTVGGVTIPSAVIQQAREEGEVIVGASIDEPDLKDPVKPNFEGDVPGITAKVQGFGSTELASKLVAEKRSGNVQQDVATFSLGTSRGVAGAGVFRRLANDHWIKQAANELGYPPNYWRSPEAKRYELPGYGLPYTLLYNTDKTSESEAPDSWENLGDDQWTGENGIVMQHPQQLSSTGGLFATLYGLWGEEKWIQVVQDIMDNNPQLLSSNSTSYRTMVQGEKALSPNYINDLVAQIAEGEDPPAATKWLEPSLQVTIPQHLVADGPNPSAGLVFVAWFLSERGQQTIGDTGRTPVHGPTASTHNLFAQVIPGGVEILPQAYNNPTYNGAAYLEQPDKWLPLYREHFGES